MTNSSVPPPLSPYQSLTLTLKRLKLSHNKRRVAGSRTSSHPGELVLRSISPRPVRGRSQPSRPNPHRSRSIRSAIAQIIEDLDLTLDDDNLAPEQRKLLKIVREFQTYIENNAHFIPNYGERYHSGERISTGFVESTVNQVISKRFVKKQQMQWTQRGAHLLLQVRTRVLDDELESTFRRWYAPFREVCQELGDDIELAA